MRSGGIRHGVARAEFQMLRTQVSALQEQLEACRRCNERQVWSAVRKRLWPRAKAGAAAPALRLIPLPRLHAPPSFHLTASRNLHQTATLHGIWGTESKSASETLFHVPLSAPSRILNPRSFAFRCKKDDLFATHSELQLVLD